ncbi:Fumarylacetoacetase [Acidimicrobium ferrooxidans DSM 10331]|uniref:Fumarylacetoacetase n=1 Tax=Acidimicrobium ferrooxidans (strain DSM 10331 / JCM 15462 / NBRC 103882 / ICP) TaxID=525909 RepID=C7LYE2_ACIFD|nr:fumarylacetoacetate hydrolase family protein [Acidimicrobium ferrooxidans]ACU53750.1 Fumarylacetoacetase [Acidimicrobium ferrooxidans DSM 10331]
MAPLTSWIDTDLEHGYGLDHLPLGVDAEGVVVRIGDVALRLAPLVDDGLLRSVSHGLVAARTLGPLFAAGSATMARLRDEIVVLASGRPDDAVARRLVSIDALELSVPIRPRTYVDFYASEAHATNAGRIFRPDGDPLPAAWRRLPIGYHGRASTVVVSGTPIVRPWGLRREGEGVVLGPSAMLDLEAEVGFVVGRASERGRPVSAGAFAEMVGGVVLANDWSARDIQALESFPLGPFAGKSFATSISAWVTPLSALDAARVTPPVQDPAPSANLVDPDPWCLDLRLELRLNGTVLTRPPAATTYWTPGQLLAHLTDNGAPVEPEDLFCSGTVSGAAPDEVGSLLELTWGGTRPVRLDDGHMRTWLVDGDEVTITATAPALDGGFIRLGEVTGRVVSAIASPW